MFTNSTTHAGCMVEYDNQNDMGLLSKEDKKAEFIQVIHSFSRYFVNIYCVTFARHRRRNEK
jgi:hypothetical protein